VRARDLKVARLTNTSEGGYKRLEAYINIIATVTPGKGRLKLELFFFFNREKKNPDFEGRISHETLYKSEMTN